jgi:hypothetical protein
MTNSIISASVTAQQVFNLFDDKPDDDRIISDFKSLKFTLDPAPPCEWNYQIENVDVSIDHESNNVSRNFYLLIKINIDSKSYESVREMMEEEGYYDEDDGFNWSNAINYFIADTTIAPDYADFDSENLNIEIIDIDTHSK